MNVPRTKKKARPIKTTVIKVSKLFHSNSILLSTQKYLSFVTYGSTSKVLKAGVAKNVFRFDLKLHFLDFNFLNFLNLLFFL